MALVAAPNPTGTTPKAEAGITSMANYWAFCGPQWQTAGNYSATAHSFNDPGAFQKAEAMAQSGMDATHGPCLTPPANYTAAFPGSRYATRSQMFASLWVNAHYCTTNPSPKHAAEATANGWPCAYMKTIIYDPGLWSSNATTRQTAINFWQPHKAYIEAIDLGDEYPCWATTSVYDSNTGHTGDQWSHYLKRSEILWYNVTNNSSLSGIPAYTTHYPMGTNGYNCAQTARWNALNAWSNLGYNDYNEPQSVWVASWYTANLGTPPPNQVCAIRADDGQDTDGGGPDIAYGTVNMAVPPATSGVANVSTSSSNIARAVGQHRQWGCDTMLWFNPGNSRTGPFSNTKNLSNATTPFARSDWGAAALWNKNYITP